jgi:BirA family transcriptional regulator, biotin operon repressor / biotin---[acetyl-CoA-carboxylase] ligase
MTNLPDRHVLMASILAALAEVLAAFAVDGFFGLKTEWQQHHAWQGLPVQLVGDAAEPLLGICLGADDDGALLLDTPAGVQRILSGDLSLRRA